METNDGVPMSEEQEIFFRRLEWDQKHQGLTTINPLYATESYGFSFDTPPHPDNSGLRISEAPDKDYPHATIITEVQFSWKEHLAAIGIIIALACTLAGAYVLLRNAIIFAKFLLGGL